MEINKLDTEMLYSTGPDGGAGVERHRARSRHRGQGRVVKFQRIGPRVMMVQPNYTWRANSQNPDELHASRTRSPKSIPVGASRSAAETDGRVLVDATDFFLRDVVNVGPRLGQLPRRPDAQRLQSAADEGVPEEHRDRHDADVLE
jgi:hypothetical protein